MYNKDEGSTAICVGGKRYAGLYPILIYLSGWYGCRFADAVSIIENLSFAERAGKSLALFSFLSEMY